MVSELIQLRHQQRQPTFREEHECSYEFRPVHRDLVIFFKTQKARRCLQNYLMEVQLVTEVRELVEYRQRIVERTKARKQRFSSDELTKVLDNARLWTRCDSAENYHEHAPEKPKKKRWSNSLKATRTSKELVRFLKKEGVKSRQELVAKADMLINKYEVKARPFSLLDLKELVTEFSQPPLSAERKNSGTDDSNSGDSEETAARPQPKPRRASRPIRSWNSVGSLPVSEEDGLQRETPGGAGGSRSDMLDVGVTQTGGLVNIIGHENNLKLGLTGHSQWPEIRGASLWRPQRN